MKQPEYSQLIQIEFYEKIVRPSTCQDPDPKNAIKMLNEFQSGNEAKAFFDSGLRSTYNWEDDNTLAQALFNLVERRYL